MALSIYGHSAASLVSEVDRVIKHYDPWCFLPEGKRQEMVVVGVLALFGTIQQRALEGKTSWLRKVGTFSRGTIAAREYRNPRTGGKVARGRKHYVRFEPAERLWEQIRGEELKQVIDPDQRPPATYGA